MNKAIFLFVFIVIHSFTSAQSLGINADGSTPNVKSILDIKSTTKGMLAPRMTTAQRNAIGAAATEEGMMVFDTDLNRYMMYTGSAWEVIGDGLWLSNSNGAYRSGKVGIGTSPSTLANLYVYNATGHGPDTSVLSVYRFGSNSSTQGGTSFNSSGVDAGIKSFSDWGNPFSAAVAAYGYLDYNQSTALVAGRNDATVLALLGYKDSGARTWAGYFTGDARVSGQFGVGVTPNSLSHFHTQTSAFDRAGYFQNDKNTSNTTMAVYAGTFGAGTGPKWAGVFESVGGTGVNIAVRAFAQGGSANWSGYFADGNVYVADNVAIGTQTMATGYLLSVNGRIISEELRIQDMSAWPDYVFEENYPLLSLYELEKRVLAEKHLPGIPDANEVSENGVLVGEMQRLIMEKIEELTLYTIAQQKQIDAQANEIEILKDLLCKGSKRKNIRCNH